MIPASGMLMVYACNLLAIIFRIAIIIIRPLKNAKQAFPSIALERCWQIIKDMPERQHAVAVLRWQQGMKQTEIATALGIAEKTVSAHLTGARRRLIAQLGRDYPFTSDDGEGPSS